MGLAIEKELRYQAEVSFCTLVDSDWSDGIVFLALDPNFEGFVESNVDNLNYRQRALATRDKVAGLANGTASWGNYMHGRGTAVADDARATVTSPNFPLAAFLSNAWGGQRLGYRTIVASGSTTAPVVEAGDGAQYTAGEWVFHHSTAVDATRGYFRKIESISTDTFTMWGGHALPTATANDVLGAVISFFPRSSVLAAARQYLSIYDSGDDSDDARYGLGCQLNLVGIEGFNAGESPRLNFEVMATRIVNEGIAQPAAGTPLGDAPLVTSTGDDTIVSLSAVGATLATIEPQSISITAGIACGPVPCVGGQEGRSGYRITGDSLDSTMVEIVVPYDDAWNTAYAAGTKYQLLIQVGTVAGRAVGAFFTRLDFAEDPARTAATDLSTSTLRFRATESQVSTAATGATLDQVRAKIELLFTCALS